MKFICNQCVVHPSRDQGDRGRHRESHNHIGGADQTRRPWVHGGGAKRSRIGEKRREGYRSKRRTHTRERDHMRKGRREKKKKRRNTRLFACRICPTSAARHRKMKHHTALHSKLYDCVCTVYTILYTSRPCILHSATYNCTGADIYSVAYASWAYSTHRRGSLICDHNQVRMVYLSCLILYASPPPHNTMTNSAHGSGISRA